MHAAPSRAKAHYEGLMTAAQNCIGCTPGGSAECLQSLKASKTLQAVWQYPCRLLGAKASLEGLLPLQV